MKGGRYGRPFFVSIPLFRRKKSVNYRYRIDFV